MLRILVAFAVALLLATSAHADEDAAISRAKAAVSVKLNDPTSAQFTAVRAMTKDGRQIVCGQINAKNRMGGYDGPKPFLFDPAMAQGAIIYGAARITDDLISGMAQLKGYEDVCG